MKLSIQQLRGIVGYNPETGILWWLVATAHCVSAGDVIDSTDDYGYIRFNVHKKTYRAHRLAWAFMTGEWPKQTIDHINGNRKDNRWANLRDVSRTVNVQNQKRPRRDNTTGFLGVTKDRGKFRAQISCEGRSVMLGTFGTAEAAHAAYLDAKRRLHEGCTI